MPRRDGGASKSKRHPGLGKASARKKPRPGSAAPPARAKTAARKPAGARARQATSAARKPAVRKPAARAGTRTTGRTARGEATRETLAVAAKTRTRPVAATAGPRGPRGQAARDAARRVEPEESGAAALPGDEFVFPETYGKTRVRLLMQSPGRLFVHWDLSPGVIDELKAEIGQRAASLARLAIRITTPGAARPLIVLLPRGARSWYVDVPGRRREYRAEIGLMLPSGEFRSVAASNVMRTPRTAPSPVPAARRVSVRGGEAPEPGAMGELPPDEATEEEGWGETASEEGGPAEAEADAPGGSSELSARGRRSRARPVPGRAGAPGGSSDRARAGSSSDLRPRR